MTADEISYAGGVYDYNVPMWYYTNSAIESSTGTQWWWLLSPYYWSGSYAHGFYVIGSTNSGCLGSSSVDSAAGVRPVISLKSCVKYSSGDGTASNPYTIEESTSGC